LLPQATRKVGRYAIAANGTIAVCTLEVGAQLPTVYLMNPQGAMRVVRTNDIVRSFQDVFVFRLSPEGQLFFGDEYHTLYRCRFGDARPVAMVQADQMMPGRPGLSLLSYEDNVFPSGWIA